MITQINVDEILVNEVIMLGHYTSQEEAVAQALQEFISRRKQQEIIKLFGTLDSDDEQAYLRKMKELSWE